jgi:hypothetical protein
VSCRRQLPLFRRGEGAIDEALLPADESLGVEFREERAPDRQPDVGGLPLGEPPPAGGRTRVRARQVAPAGTGSEDPENAFEARAVIDPRPAALGIPRPLRQQRREPRPLLVTNELLHRCPPALLGSDSLQITC